MTGVQTCALPISDKIVAVASPDGTNEDLYLFKKMFTSVIKTPHLYLGETAGKKDVEKREDNILRRYDEHPNTTGALLMGINPPQEGALTPESIASLIRNNDIKALYLMSSSFLKEGMNSEDFRDAIKNLEIIIVHSMFVLPADSSANFVFASSA